MRLTRPTTSYIDTTNQKPPQRRKEQKLDYNNRYTWEDVYYATSTTTPEPSTRLPFTATLRSCQMGADCYKQLYYYQTHRQY